MDDEEEGDATTSRTRTEKKERTFLIPLNSVKVLERRRSSIERFLTNYAIGLNKSIAEKDHQIGLVDMAMFLIVLSLFYFIPTGIVILWAPSKLGAGLCSILFLTEIVVGVVSSSILTDEPFGWREIVGSSMIILGGILAVVLAPKEDKKITA